jgi:hypothetical protein
LLDARAVANDTNAPEEVTRRVVPGLCRLGVEAALNEIAQRSLLRDGHPHDEVEETLSSAVRLTQKAAVAMFGDAEAGGDVLGRLNSINPRHANTFKALNKGAHGELIGDVKTTVNAADDLVAALKATFR